MKRYVSGIFIHKDDDEMICLYKKTAQDQNFAFDRNQQVRFWIRNRSSVVTDYFELTMNGLVSFVLLLRYSEYSLALNLEELAIIICSSPKRILTVIS